MRAQYGREIEKVDKTKSGQHADELYEVKVYSRSKKKPLAEKTIDLLTKSTDAITNSTLIKSQGIKRSAFTTYVEESSLP